MNLNQVINKYADLPFAYGLDCCQFAGECVEAQTGVNPMSIFDYSDEESAQRIIDSYGDLEAAMRDVLGEPYNGMKEGDICLLSANKGRLAAGVIYRDGVVARVPGGLMQYPKKRALLVWCT